MKAGFLLLVLVSLISAKNQEKTEKKALEQEAEALLKQAKVLEKAGNLWDARKFYANSQSFAETKNAEDAIKRIDSEIQKRSKNALQRAHRLYDQGKYEAAAQILEEGSKVGGGSGSEFYYDLALCHLRLGDSVSALARLDEAAARTADAKRRLKIKQLRTVLITGEKPSAMNSDDRGRIDKVNHLMDIVGFEVSVEDRQNLLEPPADSSPDRKAFPPSNISPVSIRATTLSQRSVSLCQGLDNINSALKETPAILYNLANCAEDTGRLGDGVLLLRRYLRAAPAAADAERVRLRIARLEALLELPEPTGGEVRNLYVSASRCVEERRYDVAMAYLGRATAIAPGFAPTAWRLALMHEATGDVDAARQAFIKYRQLDTGSAGQHEADLHLETLEAKRAKYDEEVGQAATILSDLFNRALNLTFNGLADRSLQYKRKTRQRAQIYAMQNLKVMGGFTVPSAFAQQQLAEANDHLAAALLLFPHGAAASQLIGLIYLQANDSRSSMRAFDVVASQTLPVGFYAQMHIRNQDRAVKCELTRDRLRLIFLSSYDKQGRPAAPGTPAGADGLGDIAIDPGLPRTLDCESRTVLTTEIKSIETKHGHLVLKLNKEELTLAPIYLRGAPPADGPAARRLANSYTRLFVRYQGLEESKLGAEGLTFSEKVKLGFDIANAGFGIAMGLNPIGAIGALQSFVQISREVQSVAKSLHVNLAGWVTTLEDQQEFQAGNAFRPVPTEPASFAFVEDSK